MWGSSWSADITLQLICQEPSLLDAAVIIHGYADVDRGDIHPIDTIPHTDRYRLSTELLNFLGLSPSYVNDGDFELRFGTSPWLLTWLDHVEDQEFWRFRSVSVDCTRLQTSLLMVAKWFDGYGDSVVNLLDDVEGIVGPQDHVMPELGGPGPVLAWFVSLVDWLYRHSTDSVERSCHLSPPELIINQSAQQRPFRAIRRVLLFVNGLMFDGTPAPTCSDAEPLTYGRKMVAVWPAATTTRAHWSQRRAGVLYWQPPRDVNGRRENRVQEDECKIDSALTMGVKTGRRWSGFKGDHGPLRDAPVSRQVILSRNPSKYLVDHL
jgi:hypothetical protein